MENEKKLNIMKFELIDNVHTGQYNESTTMIKYFSEGEDDLSETMSIETYYNFCKSFAGALGFCEKTIEEWFGEY